MAERQISVTALLESDQFVGSAARIIASLQAILAAAGGQGAAGVGTAGIGAAIFNNPTTAKEAEKLKTSINDVKTAAVQARKEVGSIFTPLTAQFAGIVGLLAGGAIFQKAVAEATQAAQAADRLQAALGDDVRQFQKVSDLATEIASKTSLDDDQILDVAEALLSRGVAVEKLQDSIRATVQASAALRRPLVETAAAIAATYQGGTRELARFIPGMKDLSEEALKAGAGVEYVLNQFNGVAEAQADTATGRMARAQRDLNNAYEDFGKVILPLKAELLTGAAAAGREFVESLNPELLRQAGSTLIGIGGTFLRYIPAVLAFGAAVKSVAVAQSALAAAESARGGAGLMAAISRSPVGIAAVGAAAILAADQIAKVIDGLLGIDRGLSTLEQRKALVVDVVLNLKNGKTSTADIGNAVFDVLEDASGGFLDLGRSDRERDRVAQVNSQIEKDNTEAEEKAAKDREERLKRGRERLAVLNAEYNRILEQQDEESVKRRNAIELERLELQFDKKEVATKDYLDRIDALEREELNRNLGNSQFRLDQLRNELATSTNDGPDAIQSNIRAQEEINKLTRVLLGYKQELELLDVKQQARRTSKGEQAAQQAVTDATDAQKKYNEELEKTANLVQIGSVTGPEARKNTDKAAKDFATSVDTARTALQTLHTQKLITDEQYADFSGKIDGIDTQTKRVLQEVVSILIDLRLQLQAPFEEFTNAVIDGNKSIGDSFRDLGNDILKTIQRIMVNRLVTQFLDAFLGGVTGEGAFSPGLIGGGFLKMFSGGAKGMATGGLVPGIDHGRDTVPAMLRPGEYVLPPEAVNYFGVDALESMRRRVMPYHMLRSPRVAAGRTHFNTGGPVPAPSQAHARPIMQPFFVANEQMADTILRAGPNAGRRFITDHSDLIRQIQRGET
jgi:hypothetical protein